MEWSCRASVSGVDLSRPQLAGRLRRINVLVDSDPGPKPRIGSLEYFKGFFSAFDRVIFFTAGIDRTEATLLESPRRLRIHVAAVSRDRSPRVQRCSCPATNTPRGPSRVLYTPGMCEKILKLVWCVTVFCIAEDKCQVVSGKPTSRKWSPPGIALTFD